MANDYIRCFFKMQSSETTISDVLPKISWLEGSKKAQNGQKTEFLLFAKTSVEPSLSDVFLCFTMFFLFQPSLTTNFYFFLVTTIITTFLRLFPMVAIVVANDHRQRSCNSTVGTSRDQESAPELNRLYWVCIYIAGKLVSAN